VTVGSSFQIGNNQEQIYKSRYVDGFIDCVTG
jgi:hypothetical protein